MTHPENDRGDTGRGAGNSPSTPGIDATRAPLEQPVAKLLEPFQEFVGTQSASGWVLLASTVAALLIANSPWSEAYQSLRHVELGFISASATASLSLQHWVNEGLMALFFCLLGLELKREVLVGRLSEPKPAASVLIAAVGGMVLPAFFFLAVNDHAASRDAWAIPMATDTAFALMLLVLLGDAVPAAARAFLVGLAIVDDLGAIVVIALVYTRDLDTSLLLPAGGLAGVLLLLNLSGVRRGWPYAVAGGLLWAVFLRLGLHGTLAGVVVALMAPVRPALSRGGFAATLSTGLRRFQDRHDASARSIMDAPEQQQIAEEVGQAAQDATAPLRRWEHRLDGPVSMVVVPLFAFLNAGVELDLAALGAAWQSGLSHGVFIGLLLGKPLGILLGVAIGRLSGLAQLPVGLAWPHLVGLGLLGAIGFTMSLFIGTLSFKSAPELLIIAKQSIIVSSLLAGLAGFCWLRWYASAQKNSG